MRVNGHHLFIWAAIDVDSREVLAVDASWQRSIMNAEHVLKKALRSCLNKPLILVDKGPWYLDALMSLKLSHKHVTRGLRNRIERWFRTLKERTRRFYNNFPARKNGIRCVRLFLETFTYWYNNLRTHQTLKRPPSQILS
ncbi:MAG: IS6 family transposase [Candidatus Korarchaeota archaeon]|nr:IS6 family transposase [Candidatus Korarchaeota archaeon]